MICSLSTIWSDGGEMHVFSSMHLFWSFKLYLEYISRPAEHLDVYTVLKCIPVYVFMHLYTHLFM